jgi:hypothetical protein
VAKNPTVELNSLDIRIVRQNFFFKKSRWCQKCIIQRCHDRNSDVAKNPMVEFNSIEVRIVHQIFFQEKQMVLQVHHLKVSVRFLATLLWNKYYKIRT